MKKPKNAAGPAEGFLIFDRFTVSGSRVGDICFDCECRIVEMGGEEGMTLAWCDCLFPDDHSEMQVF